MLTPYHFASLTLGIALIAAASCGGEDAKPADPCASSSHHDHSSSEHAACTDAGADASVDDEEETVPCDGNYLPFREGMETKAGTLTVKLLSVDPDPVQQKQDNHWVLEVLDASGKPVENATFPELNTWMDVHNHGGRWDPDVAEGSEPGQYDLTKVDFKMPGPWRLRFGVKVGSQAIQRSTFQICVE